MGWQPHLVCMNLVHAWLLWKSSMLCTMINSRNVSLCILLERKSSWVIQRNASLYIFERKDQFTGECRNIYANYHFIRIDFCRWREPGLPDCNSIIERDWLSRFYDCRREWEITFFAEIAFWREILWTCAQIGAILGRTLPHGRTK